jgi:hypothetical protein
MSNTVFGVAVDSANAATLGGFWARVLGRQIADGATAEHAVLPADADPAHGPRRRSHHNPSRPTAGLTTVARVLRPALAPMLAH